MSGSTMPRPDVEAVLKTLKDFQRDTADYVFRRLYTDADSTRRFLIADEVGLGKTIVTRGVIAEALEHLWDSVDRIDVLYICSNADIARQNIRKLRLSVPDRKDVNLSDRITLLPTVVKDLQNNKVNFVSFTPATSFDLKSNMGTVYERVVLYRLLNEVWESSGDGPLNVMQGNVRNTGSFRGFVNWFMTSGSVDESLTHDFSLALKRQDSLRERFEALCERFRGSGRPSSDEDGSERARLIGDLRSLLAATCIRALEPDLIVLDEFQRFKSLLDGQDAASSLARDLFNYSDGKNQARVLLLSATPYKMYTLSDETASDDHYRDFVQTVRFLQNDNAASAGTESLLREYRRELYQVRDGGAESLERLRQIKQQLETGLRKIMVRTERLAASEDRNGMLSQVPCTEARLAAQDLKDYAVVQKVSDLVDAGSVLEYWKAAPYLLNFMDGYVLKKRLKDALSLPDKSLELRRVLAPDSPGLLSWSQWQKYEALDPRNARLRELLAETVQTGAWRMLWIPPSQPYYRPEEPFAGVGVQQFTKKLVFSAWQVVPKAIAALLSYDAERRMFRSFDDDMENTPEARLRRRGLLRFSVVENRPTGMPVFALIYPSTFLMRECDPLDLSLQLQKKAGTVGVSASDVLALAQKKIQAALKDLGIDSPHSGPEDEAWYWAAPILLDRHSDRDLTESTFAAEDLAARWSDGQEAQGEDDDTRWADHVRKVRDLLKGSETLGRRPADLAEVLAQLAVAGPGTCAFRTFMRRANGTKPSPAALTVVRDQAAKVAWGFRGLFNIPEVSAMIRERKGEEPYWRRVLDYCVAGNLQAMLDEYVHVLGDSIGHAGDAAEEAAAEMAGEILGALGLRAVNLGADELRFGDDSAVAGIENRRMRVRFALRLSDDDQQEGQKEKTRSSQVRQAFNSPFWPFVLATTSIGQEGLDFHPYCHAVFHWDLPSNPVDLEQREGRVHRYKGHAVRKNVGLKLGEKALAALLAIEGWGGLRQDPWAHLFEAARRQREAGESDLIPYWIYPVEGGARIERHVPALPYSRDLERLAALRRSLVVYRMAFGQPRQEDLVQYLLANLPEDAVERLMGELQIDLRPRVNG